MPIVPETRRNPRTIPRWAVCAVALLLVLPPLLLGGLVTWVHYHGAINIGRGYLAGSRGFMPSGTALYRGYTTRGGMGERVYVHAFGVGDWCYVFIWVEELRIKH